MSDPSNVNNDSEPIGYCKPPKHSQFKKGQSGNPQGRKRRIRNSSELISAELDTIIVVKEGEKELRMTKREALIKSLVNDAIQNKRNARALLFKVLEISPPPEPFVPMDDDQNALVSFSNRARMQRDPESGKDGGNDDQESG